MRLTKEQRLPVAHDRAWTALNDVNVLKACIPGCDSLTAVSSDKFDVVVVASLGLVRTKVKGRIRVEPHGEHRPPADYTLHFEGGGGIAGRVKGEAKIHLESCGDTETLLRYTAKATLDGSIIRLGARLVDLAAQELADDFFATLNVRMHRSGRARLT